MLFSLCCFLRVESWKNRLMRFFLQAFWAVFACLCYASLPSASWSAELLARTARQREIVLELDAFRPEQVAPGERPWMLSRWDTDAGLEGIVRLPDGGGNAARHFKLLEEYYPSEKASLAEGGEDSMGVRALLDAAEAAECRFSPDYYPEVTGADVPQPDFRIMREYLQALLRRGERSAARGDGPDAERCFRAALLCGRHLTSARPSSVVYVTGLIFKVRGAQAYQNYLLRAGDAARSAKTGEYAETLSVLMRAFLWKANTALSEFEGFACLPGVVRVAREDAEAFWRKEAVIRLATLRYGIPDEAGGSVRRNPEFEAVADETLAWVAANDADASVRQMAVWAALNVTPRNYEALRHEFGE
jgi:hypothetical protein